MNKKLIIILSIIIIIISIIFIKIYYKTSNSGNNISNKSAEKIKEYILNMDSYEAVVEVTIESNKNINTYTLKQQYLKENNLYKQEVIEPSNIAGLKVTYDGENLKVESNKINSTKIYNNYKYIAENNLGLNSFVKDYIESDDSKLYEENDIIIMETKIKNGNKYNCYKKLYINKSDNRIMKLEIQDITQKSLIYILYNEIKINDLQKKDMLAFKLELIDSDV